MFAIILNYSIIIVLLVHVSTTALASQLFDFPPMKPARDIKDDASNNVSGIFCQFVYIRRLAFDMDFIKIYCINL